VEPSRRPNDRSPSTAARSPPRRPPRSRSRSSVHPDLRTRLARQGDGLDRRDFDTSRTADLDAICELDADGEGIDLVTVMYRLERKGTLDRAAGPGTSRRWWTGCRRRERRRLCAIIREASLMRRRGHGGRKGLPALTRAAAGTSRRRHPRDPPQRPRRERPQAELILAELAKWSRRPARRSSGSSTATCSDAALAVGEQFGPASRPWTSTRTAGWPGAR